MKSSDELAAEAAAQLEELERKRLKRMRQRGSDDDDSGGGDDDEPKGGYAAKRLKRAKPDPSSARKTVKTTVRLRTANGVLGEMCLLTWAIAG